MSKLYLIEGPELGKEFLIDKPEVTIGRHPSAEVSINLPDISRSHARITTENDELHLQDLGSSNGTFLNGIKLTGKAALNDEDQITIGSCVFLVELSSEFGKQFDISAEISVGSTNQNIYRHDPATKLRLVLEIAHELGKTLDIQKLLPTFLDRLITLFPQADRAFVLFVEGESYRVAEMKDRRDVPGQERNFSRTIVQRVLSEGVGIIAKEQPGSASHSISALGIHSFICVPLHTSGDRPVGVLQLDCFHPSRSFANEDLHILSVISMNASVVIENAALHAETIKHERIKRDLDLSRLSQMVAGVAHEINNPLAFVSNNATVLQRDLSALRDLIRLYQKSDETLQTHLPELLNEVRTLCEEIDLDYTLENLDLLLHRSHDGLNRIQRIVADLRNFARLDQSEFDTIDINPGIESTVSTARGLANQNEVQLRMELGQLPKIYCSPSKINQVVFNLLTNAIEACPGGGTVSVRTCAAGDKVEIQIIDTGVGVNAEIRDKLFDPFFTTKPLGQGVGLGLSISYGIVQDHQGSIEVDSTPGAGSRFVVKLPVAEN